MAASSFLAITGSPLANLRLNLTFFFIPQKTNSPAKKDNVVNNFPDAEPSTSFGTAVFSNLVEWRVKDEASEDDKSSEVKHVN